MVSPTFTSGPSTLGWWSPRDSHRKNCSENPGPVLQKLWHIETTPFKKFMTNLRKWKKLSHVPSFPTSTVKLKSYGDKPQMSFIRETSIAFFPKWSLNFQIADTCTHCVPIFIACYGCRLFSSQKFLPFALLKHNPETYLDAFQAWLEYQTGKLYAKQTVSRTIRQVGLSEIKRWWKRMNSSEGM